MTQLSEQQLSFHEREPLRRFAAVAVIYDLEGFTDFCTRPQIEKHIPTLLNRVAELICSCLDPAWVPSSPLAFSCGDWGKPTHLKFLGDGALVLWPLPHEVDRSRMFLMALLNRLFVARQSYSDVLDHCRDDFGVLDVPERLRFGLAAGDVVELTGENGKPEFVGFPINLASRLQSYCRPLGFLASARIGLPSESLEANGFQKVKALGLRGFSTEVLIADRKDFDALPDDERERLFSVL